MKTLKYFFQNLKSNRQSHVISMLSLAPGLACCLLIFVWLWREVRTDRFIPNIDRIVTVSGYHEGQEPFVGAPPAVAPALSEELPEVQAATRISWGNAGFKYQQETYNAASMNVDAGFFEVFGLRFTEGAPFSDEEFDRCVIYEDFAVAVFGDKSPLGQVLEVGSEHFTVCGVAKPTTQKTTVQALTKTGGYITAPVLLPIKRKRDELNAWYNNSYQTYLLLRAAPDINQFSEKIKNRNMQAAPEFNLYLKAFLLKDRYLYRYQNIAQVRLLGIVALVILAVACINFINLTTAEFGKSTFQTGIRKILGATRKRLIYQYFINSSILVFISFIFAYCLAILFLPLFNRMLNANFVMHDFITFQIIGLSVAILIVTTLFSCLYPAISVSSFNPGESIKKYNPRKTVFRQVLVVLQFTVAIALIISTLIVRKQIGMYKHMDLGYNWDEVVYISTGKLEHQQKAPVLAAELQKEPSVVAAAVSIGTPASIFWNGVGWSWEGLEPGLNPLIWFNYIDKNWSKVYDIKPVEGSFFSDEKNGIVINKRMAELMQENEPVGKYITRDENVYKITGVLDQFHYNDFKQESEPLILLPLNTDDPNHAYMQQTVSVRMTGSNPAVMQQTIRDVTKDVLGEELSGTFMSSRVENWLQTEQQTSTMISFFTILSILISCMGLFGLATFIITQKQKEIGIRRVNGARVGEIVWLLNYSFLKPVLISFIIACPVAWFIMNRWLQTYLQRTDMSWWLFAAAGAGVVLLTMLTLTMHSIRASNVNPAETLRNE